MFNTTDDAEDPDRLYELYAVVVHIGGNAYHGHYVSVIKTHDRGWLLFDDEMVEPVDKSYVRNFFGDKPGQACAYVLFYQETTVEAMRREQEAEGLAEVALASQEADVALHSQANGHFPKVAPIPGTPTEEHNGFASLDHAVTSPPILSSPTKETHPMPPSFVTPPFTHPIPATSPISIPTEATKVKSKEEKEREKRESKEAEKVRKIAQKEKEKADEKRRKEQEAARKEQLRTQAEEHRKAAEETRKAILLSKQTAEEEERKRRESLALASSSGDVSFAESGNGNGNGNGNHSHSSGEKDSKSSFGLGSLSRNHKGSKSMRQKSFSFLSGGKSDKNIDKMPIPEGASLLVDREIGSNKNNRAVEEEARGIPMPEKHDKMKRDRFSFSGLGGRKKSNLTNA